MMELKAASPTSAVQARSTSESIRAGTTPSSRRGPWIELSLDFPELTSATEVRHSLGEISTLRYRSVLEETVQEEVDPMLETQGKNRR